MGELSRLFAPDRVAVIGASEEAGTVGNAVTSNLLDANVDVDSVLETDG